MTNAFGSSSQDTSGVISALYTGGVKNSDDLLVTLAKIGASAKAGSVEVKDMAGEFAKSFGLLHGSSSLNISRSKLATDLAATYQVTNLITNNAAESTTAINSLISELKNIRKCFSNIYS